MGVFQLTQLHRILITRLILSFFIYQCQSNIVKLPKNRIHFVIRKVEEYKKKYCSRNF